MKILFVSSGNSGKISPIVKAQADSLKEMGIDIGYFLIAGKGISGYLNNIPKLAKHLRSNNYDIVHAHYSLSAYVASLAGAKPLVVSLMGSDVKSSGILNTLNTTFVKYKWDITIVKSQDMRDTLGISHIKIIPNGTDINKFGPINKIDCRQKLNWDNNKLHILFAADPDRKVKNYSLFIESIKIVRKKYKEIKIHYLKNIPNTRVPVFMNAADIVCLSSKWEGSPNVIKEAMACNRPIVCTNVGDVEILFNDIEGCFLCRYFSINEYAKQLEKAIQYSKMYVNTKGRDRIIDIGLDSKNTAENIIKIYKNFQ